ncbi:hypothetical protein D4764_04G0015110 [Takifugu flavidus]|uniref:Uncharacterized protein n=1 Tax=Takifugu flavidus TaxID=433684 RepID=A0A5C6N5W1_9TELE|nr:hypothetical protein D4764_04G0015110 [Takifugu flavidus]
MLNQGLEQRSKTKADHQPAHPPGQQVGSKLTYAQVLMMPPRKRAPPPDLSPPYPEQEHQPAGTRHPIKLRYARLGLEQRSKTKADHQPAHPPEQQVGSKLTYAQVLMMPPRKRAPPPDLSPPYPEQEHQPAGTRRPIKLRYARL